MQSSSEGSLIDIIDLAQSLRQEQLFISSERNAFGKLKENLHKNSENVSQLAWICAQQRQNLNNLVVSRPETGPSSCCHRANILENMKFISATKAKLLKYEHITAYTKLFNYLHRSPYLLAQCLAIGDRVCSLTPDQMNSVVQTISTGLYDNAMHPMDIENVLKLLQELIQTQIVVSDNPRRMLRAGSCAFSRLYLKLNETLFSAKLFLTAALHEPIMKVLIDDEQMLEIDANKAIGNISLKERTKRFGTFGSAEYDERIKRYTQETIESLFHLVNRFMKSLQRNWAMFPSTLRWLVQTMCNLLKRSNFSEKDINAILTDMVFTNFICPAIVSPDLYGISDAAISENARFNLIQIGQIIQMLALINHTTIEGKVRELYDKFDQNLVSELLDDLVSNEFEVGISGIAMASQQNSVGRKSVLATQSELNIFVNFLRNVLENDELNISGEHRRNLGEILDKLPDKWENIINDSTTPKKQSLINLGKSTKHRLAKSISLNVNSDDQSSGNGMLNGNYNNNNHVINQEEVLIIPISVSSEETKFRLMSEEEILNMSNGTVEPGLTEKNVEELERRTEEESSTLDGVVLRSNQKHARFSLSQDGNTSDNLEVVSEAPSNHSVASSMDLEENDQNDNLSDMVSANVSGRGTPNISGRDTPSSQVTEGENRPPIIQTPQMAKIFNKTRSDIEDKFCKFEIKKLMEGDETISIISDTWSTDVLASDSETIEASDRDRNFSTPLIPSSVILPGDNNYDPLSTPGSQLRANNLDVSETQSESAWSTDVLASDSEKMTEIDTDDNQSIAAKSDITDAGETSHAEFLIGHRAPDSPFFAPRLANPISFRTPDSPMYTPRTPHGPELQFFGDEAPRVIPRLSHEEFHRFSTPVTALLRHSRDPIRLIQTGPTNYEGGAMGESSNSTNPNPFLSAFESSSRFVEPSPPIRIGYERSSFLSTVGRGRTLRQNSAESSNSNFDPDDKKEHSFDYRKQTKDYVDNTPPVNVFKPQDDLLEPFIEARQHANDQNYGFPVYDNMYDPPRSASFNPNVNIIKTSSEIINPFLEAENRQLSYDLETSLLPKKIFDEDLSDDLVEHRRFSTEQRHASFDGRRNGMQIAGASTSNPTNSMIAKSRVSYENHSLFSEKRSVSVPETSVTDDIKQLQNQPDDELILIQKTQSLALGNGHLKSSVVKCTGAIPKSISFDSSADKINRHHMRRNDSRGHGFLNKIKQGFKNRRSNKFRNQEGEFRHHSDSLNARGDDLIGDLNQLSRSTEADDSFIDINEDILAKYKRKASTSSDAATTDSTGSNSSSTKSKSSQSDTERNDVLVTDDTCFLFNNAKRKLRIVLSSTDLQASDFHYTTQSSTSPLLIYLKIQLAQALNQQNLQQISYVSEAIRCVNSIDPMQHQKLLDQLQKDLRKRQSYLQYLIRYRQNLLFSLENIQNFELRLQNDRETCNRHLIMVCIRMFLEKRELAILTFQNKFTTLTVVDEKIDYLEEFMGELMNELKNDGLLQGMADWQLQEARNCIERILLQRLYRQVMFPNDDGDINRDLVLRDHIRKLSRVITPSHTSLRIPQIYLSEAPWPFAQHHISYISAYKTPREKVQCVVRCITTIMNLLSMASDRAPAADDLIPVLIYVIIKANPPYLLSTIEYVNSFMDKKLEGEVEYWWTQFCSAVQYIKTID